LRGKPLLFRGDSHELCPSAGLRQIAGRTARRLLFHRFDAFLAVGKANAEYIAKSGVPASRIHLVPHCVDNERFRAGAADARAKAREWKRELGMPEEDMVVLFAGKFEEKKRPLDLLNAFRDARNRRNGPVKNKVSLLYVGSGPQEQLLREEAARHADLPVFFAPFQNQTEMPKAYAAADLFVLPSFGRGETWGLAVNEAMNLGRPVIVSSHVGCGPDLVVPGETGWTFPAGETGSLSACLSEALEKPETLRKMGEAARRRVEHYSYASATRSLLKVLEAVG
jgi:glycosyltransferase involved in cell wall biosynthesis